MKNGLHVDLTGNQIWYKDNEIHRLDGPAYISAASKSWWQYGVRHRTDGPAIVYINGQSVWYINGNCVAHTAEEFKDYLIQQNLNQIL